MKSDVAQALHRCGATAGEHTAMIKVVETGLARTKHVPLNGTVKAGPVVYTSQIPKDPATAQVETGDIESQTRRLLLNFEQSMAAAGGSLADVAQATIYLTDPADFPGMNKVYAEFFREPYPNRATVVVKALMVPGMRVEMVAQA